MAQVAPDATEQRVVEGDELLREPSLIHQLGRKDEVGDGDQHVGGDAGKHAVGDDAHHSLAADHVAARYAGQRHDDGNRRADQQKKHEDQDREGHQDTCFGSAPMASFTISSAVLCWPSTAKPWERWSRMIAPLRGTVTAVKYCGIRIISETM